MRQTESPIGLYVHVPFCVRKCPYCDFYSLTATEETMDRYTEAVCAALHREGERFPSADTLYFGGGTPSLLGPKRLHRLVTAARDAFSLHGAEITMEANPAEHLYEVFSAFEAAGGNRVSIGLQAANDAALQRLGRRHTVAESGEAVAAAKRAGIRNVSLDLMLGTEGQRPEDVRAAAQVCAAWEATHVSAYLLKLEEGTPFGKTPPPLPDEDATAALYLEACEALDAAGYRQYEISNFARDGFASRHNLKYWNSEPYLGLGPSAHSFYGGRRWTYPRDLAAFLGGADRIPEADEDGTIAEAGEEEYALLRLRLCDGLQAADFEKKFARPLPEGWRERAAALPSSLVRADAEGIRLTREGFLLSNTLIAAILFA